MKRALPLLLLAALCACEPAPTALDPAKGDAASSVRLIPRSSPLEVAEKSVGGRSPASSHSCVVSTLLDGEAEGNYANRAFWLEFPPEVMRQAGGRTVKKAYVLGSRAAGPKARSLGAAENIVRLAQCQMPDSPLADALMEKKLRQFGLGSWAVPRSGGSPSKQAPSPGMPSASDSWWHCAEWFVVLACGLVFEDNEWIIDCWVNDIRCIDWELVWEEPDYGGPGYPDTWESEFPGEGCEPWELCYLGPDGVPMPAPQDPCAASPAPVYCTNPCATSDAIIDSHSNQITFESLAQSSGFHLSNIGDRNEDGGWITKTGNIYGFAPFPPEWTRLPCGIVMPENHYVYAPQNTVAIVHTHPFSVGENTLGVCGSGGSASYSSGLSEDDLDVLFETMTHLGNFSIKGYVIDRSNIVPFSSIAISPAIERCGY